MNKRLESEKLALLLLDEAAAKVDSYSVDFALLTSEEAQQALRLGFALLSCRAEAASHSLRATDVAAAIERLGI